jgi:hypothetical protein
MIKKKDKNTQSDDFWKPLPSEIAQVKFVDDSQNLFEHKRLKLKDGSEWYDASHFLLTYANGTKIVKGSLKFLPWYRVPQEKNQGNPYLLQKAPYIHMLCLAQSHVWHAEAKESLWKFFLNVFDGLTMLQDTSTGRDAARVDHPSGKKARPPKPKSMWDKTIKAAVKEEIEGKKELTEAERDAVLQTAHAITSSNIVKENEKLFQEVVNVQQQQENRSVCDEEAQVSHDEIEYQSSFQSGILEEVDGAAWVEEALADGTPFFFQFFFDFFCLHQQKSFSVC